MKARGGNYDTDWVHMPRCGAAARRSALPAFVRQRWQGRASGIGGLADGARLVRDFLWRRPATPVPDAVDRLWRTAGRPSCWVNVRTNGRCQIVVPDAYVLHVLPRSAAARRRQGETLAIQRACEGIAPRVLEAGDSYYREEFIALRRLDNRANGVYEAAATIRQRTGSRQMSVGQFLDDVLPAEMANAAVREAAGALDRAAPIGVGPVHGDLLPRNLFRRPDRTLVALDWEYARQAPVTYDVWHARFWDWMQGDVSRGAWRDEFGQALATHLPALAPHAALHDTLNCLSTFGFFGNPQNCVRTPAKADAAAQLLGGAEVFSG